MALAMLGRGRQRLSRPQLNRFKVWISGQVRRVTKAIRREMRKSPFT
jgi:hypothetical protein